jgi:hypothetical protein
MFERAAKHIGLDELFADIDTASVGVQIRDEVVTSENALGFFNV